ncbi:FAM10 family protein [Actinidia chinensis var. chinensis]|uniref:FAM10 family protein n=1 Tax=Actinidia chinensis var. chinensis TaxID=1590841 RepID=A0A2R6QK23_ACTCC|nr:FAM10 family protein [Actinidia chinensis var. chinensis]
MSASSPPAGTTKSPPKKRRRCNPSLGCKLPSSAYKPGESIDHNKLKSCCDAESDKYVNDIEEEHRPQEHVMKKKRMGDSSIEVSEENHDASQEDKSQAMEAISEGKLEDAIENLTRAILLNPTSTIMYVSRVSVNLKMKKPSAAIRDANAALEVALVFR